MNRARADNMTANDDDGAAHDHDAPDADADAQADDGALVLL